MLKMMFSILLLAAAMASSAQEPRMSGVWQMKLDKSNLAGTHPFPDYQLKWIVEQDKACFLLREISRNASFANIPVEDTDQAIKIHIDGSEQDIQRPSSFPGVPPTTVKVKAEWQGGTLLITETGAGWGGPSVTLRRLFISRDGAQLTELLESHSALSDTEERIVFERTN